MRKAKQIEDLIKRAIRDELALNPLKSVAQIRLALFKQGYQQVYGKLDWHYVSKLVKQVRLENLASLYSKDRGERLAIIKERHRVITQKLVGVLEGEASTSYDKPNFPTHTERIAAANTILKWDMALFFAEEQVKAIEVAEQKENVPLKVHPVVLEIQPPKLTNHFQRGIVATAVETS
ncbi:MAG: hypothetical protein RIQ56_980 [Candidatus Parcubacteria bacterium]|jgi:hypothetical protein